MKATITHNLLALGLGTMLALGLTACHQEQNEHSEPIIDKFWAEQILNPIDGFFTPRSFQAQYVSGEEAQEFSTYDVHRTEFLKQFPAQKDHHSWAIVTRAHQEDILCDRIIRADEYKQRMKGYSLSDSARYWIMHPY